MRYLAIDYGLKRIGLAHCDPEGIIVAPLCQIDNQPGKEDKVIQEISRIIDEHTIEAIVMGLPLNMDDSEGSQARLTREFANRLAGKTELPLYFQDERLSSMAADEMLEQGNFTRQRRKARRDMLAACEILRDFLDKV